MEKPRYRLFDIWKNQTLATEMSENQLNLHEGRFDLYFLLCDSNFTKEFTTYCNKAVEEDR